MNGPSERLDGILNPGQLLHERRLVNILYGERGEVEN